MSGIRPNASEQVLEVSLAEWLRRCPAKALYSVRVCSNHTGDEIFLLRVGGVAKKERSETYSNVGWVGWVAYELLRL